MSSYLVFNQRKNRWSRAAGGGKIQKKCISLVPPEAEKSEKMHFYWYLFLKNHYSNALPERGAASSNPGIHQISPQKWWTQVWVHHFWDLDVYTQRKSKNMKNDGPNSGYIIFRVFFFGISQIYRGYSLGRYVPNSPKSNELTIRHVEDVKNILRYMNSNGFMKDLATYQAPLLENLSSAKNSENIFRKNTLNAFENRATRWITHGYLGRL